MGALASQHPAGRRTRALIRVLQRGSLVLIVGLPVGASSYFVLNGDVTRYSLSHSVANQWDGASSWADCEPGTEGRWRCNVLTQEQSDAWTYDVSVAGPCWSARHVGAYASGEPRTLTGCVGISDELRLGDRLGLSALSRPAGYY